MRQRSRGRRTRHGSHRPRAGKPRTSARQSLCGRRRGRRRMPRSQATQDLLHRVSLRRRPARADQTHRAMRAVRTPRGRRARSPVRRFRWAPAPCSSARSYPADKSVPWVTAEEVVALAELPGSAKVSADPERVAAGIAARGRRRCWNPGVPRSSSTAQVGSRS
jgi:hypothetical protein